MLRNEDADSQRLSVRRPDDGDEDSNSLFVGNSNTSIPPGARSPHPYRRQSIDIQDRIFVTNLAARQRQQPFATSASEAVTSGAVQRSRRLSRKDSELSSDASSSHREGRDGDGGTRWALTTSPSDSGTEADDERAATYLRGLPAATGKPRKGFKGRSGATTPSDFDGVKQKLLLDEAASLLGKRRKPESDKSSARDTSTEKRNREYSWKWRGELLRRVLEHIFLCGLTHWCLEGRSVSLADWSLSYDWHKAKTEPVEKAKWLVATTLLVYLARAFWMWTQYLRATWRIGSMTMDKVPSPTDPGATLYPSLVPLAVASAGTMTSSKPAILLLNLILSPCTYSLVSTKPWLSNLQWAAVFLLALPFKMKHTSRMPFYEEMTLLLPLHESLVATIQHFFGSSLLSAESQLVSIGLINLLFFAESPQSTILFALLWMNGMAILLGCKHVMSWSTTLARIPGWRFRSPRHPRAPASANQLPQTAIGTLLRTSSFFASTPSRDSSDDREWVSKHVGSTPRGNSLPYPGSNSVVVEVSAPTESSRSLWAATPEKESRQTGRRNTLPSITRTGVDAPESPTRRQPKRRKARSKPFLWLTRTQASVVKWILAVYIYAFTLLSILLPIRWYIQERALNGYEPVGWALSYLFGNFSYFRVQIILSDLDSWIPLPPRNYLTLSELPSSPVLPFVPSVPALRTFIGSSTTRLVIIAWCIFFLALGLLAVFHLRAHVEVDTRRKVFHGMMVAMFLPTSFVDPCFISLALALMLAIFLLLDLFRATQLPPISRPLTHFLAPYVDGRDHKGPVVISPIFLLIGCAIPLWLSLSSARRVSATEDTVSDPFRSWEVEGRDVSMVAGVVCVGMGDAAASLVGRRYGRRRWIWSGGKSLEGSAAFVVAVSIGLLAAKAWMLLGGWEMTASTGPSLIQGDTIGTTVGKTLIAGAGASFTEAVLTGGNDNVIVPVILWLLVRCLNI